MNNVDENLIEVSKKLTLAELGLFVRLLRYLDFKDKKLKYKKKYLNRSSISQLLMLNYKTVSKHVVGLVREGILIEHTKGRVAEYEVSDEYAFIGEFKHKRFTTKLFIVEFSELTEGLSLNEVGLFYLLLPYMNSALNIICYNPYELDPKKIEKISSLTEIGRIANIDSSWASRVMSGLRNKSAIIDISRGRMFVFNSNMVTRRKKRIDFQDLITVLTNEYGK